MCQVGDTIRRSNDFRTMRKMRVIDLIRAELHAGLGRAPELRPQWAELL